MNTREFLTHVWPAVGPYCVARPFTDDEIAKLPVTRQSSTNRPFRQWALDDVNDAVMLSQALDQGGHDVYFAVGALVKGRVTNDKGKLVVSRKADNIREFRSYFLDLDVGVESHKYASREDAIAGIHKFCHDLKFPKPTLTSSGGGVHVYWSLQEPVPRDEWKRNAEQLKALTIMHDLRNDAGIVADAARVLRVVGTHNHKHGQSRPVTTLMPGVLIPNAQFHSLLGLRTITGVSTSVLSAHGPPLITLDSNTDRYEAQEYSLPVLMDNCRALAYSADPDNQRKGKEAVPEPAWTALVQTVRLVRNGVKAAHLVSSHDPRYDEAGLNRKLEAWERRGFNGPATCAQIQSAYEQHYNADCCNGCPSRGKIKTPLVVAKYVPIIPHILVPAVIAKTVVPTQTPDLPDGYVRTPEGIGMLTANPKTGANDVHVFCPYDMHPIRMRYDEDTNIEEDILWRIKFPRGEWMDIGIPYVSKMQLQPVLAKRGIHIQDHDSNYQSNFMTAYVRKLQNDLPREKAFNKLGWRPDGDFVLGETLYKKDGSTEEHAMGAGLINATHHGIKCAGSYEQWQQDVMLYGRPGLEPIRTYFMSTFASVLYKFTGLVATAINASGRTGLGKSTAMEVAGSVWGEPDSLKIHGDEESSTKAGAEGLIGAMNNLPVFMDEITMRDPKQVAKLIFSYSGGKGKIRSTIHGGVRADTATWSNFLMLNANNDEYERMAAIFRESSQHIVRLVQIPFEETNIISKAEGDKLRASVHVNYGWAGRIFIEHLVLHQDAIRKRVLQLVTETDKAVKAKSEERFWTGWIACVHAVYEICANLNIVVFPLSTDIPWLYRQFGLMRRTVISHVPVASEVISEFLDANLAATLRIGAKGSSNIDDVLAEPNRELAVRQEVDTGRIYISRAIFRQYCLERGINFQRAMFDMLKKNILLRENMLKVLGADTKFESGRVRCLEIDSVALITLNHIGTP